MNLNKLFLDYCKKNNLEINSNQLDIIEELSKFYNLNFNSKGNRGVFEGYTKLY